MAHGTVSGAGYRRCAPPWCSQSTPPLRAPSCAHGSSSVSAPHGLRWRLPSRSSAGRLPQRVAAGAAPAMQTGCARREQGPTCVQGPARLRPRCSGPGSEGPGLPRRSEGPGLPRRSEGPGLPRRSEGPGLPRRSQGPGLPRRSEGPGLPRRSEGPGLPRRSEGPGFPRRSEGQGLPLGLTALACPAHLEEHPAARVPRHSSALTRLRRAGATAYCRAVCGPHT